MEQIRELINNTKQKANENLHTLEECQTAIQRLEKAGYKIDRQLKTKLTSAIHRNQRIARDL